MIRPFCSDDSNAVVRLWLEASCQAHSFLPPSYWEAAAADMREVYLPMSDEIVVHVDDAVGEVERVVGGGGVAVEHRPQHRRGVPGGTGGAASGYRRRALRRQRGQDG